MKRHFRLNSIAALVLALSLVFTGCVSAFADDIEVEGSEYLFVVAGIEDGAEVPTVRYETESEDVEGLLNGSSLSAGNLSDSVEVQVNGGGQVTVSTGAVTNTEDDYPVVGVYSYDNGSYASVSTGNVIAAGTAVDVSAQSGGSAYVETGSLTGETGISAHTASDEISEDPVYTGITVYSGSIAAEHTGIDASAGADYSYISANTDSIEAGGTGIDAGAYGNGTWIDVSTGGIEAGNTGINATAYGDGSWVWASADSIEAGDTGIYAETGGVNSSIDIYAGNIEAGNGGVAATTYGTGSYINVYAGDIDAGMIGISTSAFENGSSIRVEAGDIEAEYDGVFVSAIGEDSSVSIEAGDIKAEGTGIWVQAGGESSSAYVNAGDVDGGKTGVIAMASPDGSYLFVSSGDISGEDLAVGAYASQGAYVGIFADGDITSADGIGASLCTDEGGFVLLGSTGTISGEAQSIVVSEGTDVNSVQIIAWKVDPNKDGHLVETESFAGFDDEENPIYEYAYDEAAKTVEKNILYIIKVEQPKAGGKLSAVDEGGNAAELAYEGEKVLLKIDVAAGYKITGAYNGLGQKIPLLQDAEGNYYVEVEKGGGVYLSATFAKMRRAAVPLLTLKDESGKIEISFFADGSFRAVMEDGSKEKGQFKKDENGQLILVDAAGSIITLGEDGAFTYTSTADSTLSYSFIMPEADRETLLKAAK